MQSTGISAIANLSLTQWESNQTVAFGTLNFNSCFPSPMIFLVEDTQNLEGKIFLERIFASAPESINAVTYIFYLQHKYLS